jgi:hypothetical protein
MIPNIPIPTKNISSEAEVNTRLLKSESGMTGSGARSSMGTKTASRMAEITNPATTRPASQASPWPTHGSASNSETTEAVMVAAPR